MRETLIEKTFEWDLTSNPEQLWPILSDTMRLNQALDLPAYSLSETFDRDSIRRRYGEMIEDGTRIRWEEPLFEWVEGCWWRWRRFYEEGPLRETGGILMLNPIDGGGTRVGYTLSIEPNGALGRMLVATGHLKVAAKAFEAISRQADAFCTRPHGDFFSNLAAGKSKQPVPRVIPNPSDRIEDKRLLAQLSAWLTAAPLADRHSLRPLRLARCLGVSPAEALRACLLGTISGALVRRYRAICPSCRGSAVEASTLSDLSSILACRRCGAEYPLDLAGNVEALFAASDTAGTDSVYCASGPTTATHIPVQQNVGALEQRDLVFEMPAGVYQARALDGPVSDVVELSKASGLQVQVTDAGIVIAQREKGCVIENHCKRSFTVLLERCEWPPETLPAADLLTEQVFRDLAPDESLIVGETADAGFGAIINVIGASAAPYEFEGGAVFERNDDRSALVFASLKKAMTAAEAMREKAPTAQIAIDCGTLKAAQFFDGLGYVGTVPDTARALCESAPAGAIMRSKRVEAALNTK